MSPGGTRANHKYLADWVKYEEDVTPEEQLLLCDAQTSGGLLAAVPASAAAEIVSALEAAGTLAASVVGRIGEPGPGTILVRRS